METTEWSFWKRLLWENTKQLTEYDGISTSKGTGPSITADMMSDNVTATSRMRSRHSSLVWTSFLSVVFSSAQVRDATLTHSRNIVVSLFAYSYSGRGAHWNGPRRNPLDQLNRTAYITRYQRVFSADEKSTNTSKTIWTLAIQFWISGERTTLKFQGTATPGKYQHFWPSKWVVRSLFSFIHSPRRLWRSSLWILSPLKAVLKRVDYPQTCKKCNVDLCHAEF